MLLDIITEQLINYLEPIVQLRKQFINEINGFAETIYKELSNSNHTFNISYIPSITSDFENEMKSLGIKYYKKRPNPDNLPTMGFTIRPANNNQPTVMSFSSDYMGTKVQTGDIITHINGTELNESTYQDLFESITKMKIGDEYQLEIIRNGKSMKIIENLYDKYDRNVFEFDNDASNEAIELRNKVIPKYD